MSKDKVIRGKAWVFGDHIDTDVIIPVRYCTAYTPEELGPHAMAGIDPDFASRIQEGDIIVGGANFGCGSSRENAPLALLGARVGAVVAISFGRIFFRNSINVGLPIIECSELAESCTEGDEILIDPEQGRARNVTNNKDFAFSRYPEGLTRIVNAGGLVPHVRARLSEINKP